MIIPLKKKGLAIKMVMEMPIHNGINKKQIFKALEWLFYQHFTIQEKEGGLDEQ